MKAFFGLLVVFAVAGCGGKSSSSNPNAVVLSPASGSALPDGVVGQSYSQTFTVASGGTAPYQIAALGAPSGLALVTSDSTATLSGVPTQGGAGTLQLQVTDAKGRVTQASYPLTIEQPAGAALSLAPSAAPNGIYNTDYSFTFYATGGLAPYEFGTTGSLPPGLQLGPGGGSGQAVITGKPMASGTYTFTVNVTDAASPPRKGSMTYSITIQ